MFNSQVVLVCSTGHSPVVVGVIPIETPIGTSVKGFCPSCMTGAEEEDYRDENMSRLSAVEVAAD